MAGVNKPGKPKSKRTPVRLRHKIEKASSAKQKKARKAARKNPEWRSKLRKDPGIPNMFPYKDRVLAEIEEGKRLKEEERARRREAGKAVRLAAKREEKKEEGLVTGDGGGVVDALERGHDVDMEDVDDEANPMAALLASAKAAAADYDAGLAVDSSSDEDSESDPGSEDGDVEVPCAQKEGSRKAFDKIFKQVVDRADVILYVLDARDPNGTRSKEVERSITAAASGEKRLVLILNKIDLVPPSVLKAWLLHLRRYFPTLPLRASNPAPNARTFNHKQLTVQGTSSTLFRALKSYAATKQLKRAISVGVIGYPNVGKSSVINALTSRLGSSGSACPVGAEAGVTTSLRDVKLDNKIKLIDSPGIVFPSTSSSHTKETPIQAHARLILLNAIPPKQIIDPVPAVTLLLKRLSASDEMMSKLMDVYGLPPLLSGESGNVTTDFLVQVARKRGRLGKGGVPNLGSAAMGVVVDWRDGRIQGWVDAPVLEVASGEDAGLGVDGQEAVKGDRKEIVKEWAAEFKIEGLWGDCKTGGDGDGDGDKDGDEEMV